MKYILTFASFDVSDQEVKLNDLVDLLYLVKKYKYPIIVDIRDDVSGNPATYLTVYDSRIE